MEGVQNRGREGWCTIPSALGMYPNVQKGGVPNLKTYFHNNSICTPASRYSSKISRKYQNIYSIFTIIFKSLSTTSCCFINQKNHENMN